MASPYSPTATTSKQLHVAMFPWLAFGHIIPFLQLSKFIAKKGHRVSFLSTTRNIQRLPLSSTHDLITLVPFTLPPIDHLSQKAEATMDVCTHDIQHLKKAFDGLQDQVTQFLEENSPDWIIYDFVPYWLPPVAAELGISRAFFSTFNPWLLAFGVRSFKELMKGSHDLKTMADFMAPPELKLLPLPNNICLRKHEMKMMLDSNTSLNASGVSDMFRSGMILQGSDCILIRCCYEFEPQWLTLSEDSLHLPVIPVGLLPPAITTNVGDEKDDAWLTIKKWLDGQQKGQVVYAALGSEITLTETQVGELALGLEQSDLPFFWALRLPAGDSTPVELPEGFVERTRNRGMVWKSWVPQLRILSHESVGAFFTHCGWGSIVEGLTLGHPLIMLPFMMEEGLNARALVEKHVGVEIPINEEDGSFTKDSVAKSVRLVVVEDEGKMYKAKAMELSRLFGDMKLQNKYVDNLVQYMEKHRSVPSDAIDG